MQVSWLRTFAAMAAVYARAPTGASRTPASRKRSRVATSMGKFGQVRPCRDRLGLVMAPHQLAHTSTEGQMHEQLVQSLRAGSFACWHISIGRWHVQEAIIIRQQSTLCQKFLRCLSPCQLASPQPSDTRRRRAEGQSFSQSTGVQHHLPNGRIPY